MSHQSISANVVPDSTSTPQPSLESRPFTEETKIAAAESVQEILQLPGCPPESPPDIPPNAGFSSNSVAQGHSLSHFSIQPKLTIGQPDDAYEQEADRVAHQIMQMPEMANSNAIQQEEDWSFPNAPLTPVVQCQQEDQLQLLPQLQRQSEGDRPRSTNALENRLAAQSGRGNSLSPETRAFMEPRFGFDFSQVRVHTDSEAVQMNRDLSAQAFAHGQDIFFAEGKYNPNADEGKELLAHELTHVIQQTGAIQAKLAFRSTHDAIIQRDAETGGGSNQGADPGALADQIYDALNWVNNESTLFQALQGHDAGVRTQIQNEFQSRHNQSLKSYLQEQLEGDSLVKAFALLSSTNYHEQHTAMALCLIPVGTRDEELFRILYSLPEAGRRELERRYNEAFSDIGTGSLKGDLKDDLSDWRKEKSLALLYHNLTSAEDLYFDSLGIAGTHTEAVVNRIQSEWDKGPAAFAQFERDWNQYVKSAGEWNDQEPWNSMSLAQAMESELSGEELELVQSVLRGQQSYEERIGVQEGPLTEEQQFQREDIELQVADSALAAATTGGYTGWGTNEPQVFRAVSTIRRIWQQRIDRARQAHDETRLQRYQQDWEQRRQTLLQFIPSEMDAGTTDNQRVQLLVTGDLTPADEVYLASQDHDNDRVVSLITRYWAQGQIDQLLTQANNARTDSNGAVLRPSFNVLFTVPVTSGITARRVYTLTGSDRDNAGRGALRLKLELDEGDSDSDLQRAYELMSGNDISGALRNSVIERFAANHLNETEGDTPARKFLSYISNRYQSSTACWRFRDLLDPTTDPAELVRRAEGRLAASQTGILDVVLNDAVSDYDAITGEDTQAVTQESLERLRFIANRSRVRPDELQAMMVMAGVETPEALASMEYSLFQSRLEELRQLKRTIAEAIATVVELTVEAALTVATGGAAAGALLASLSATVAGMLLREAMLGQDYNLLSRENAQQLVLAVASHGFNAIGRGVFADVITPERLRQLGRAGSFLEGAATEAFTQLNMQILTAGFEGRAPTAESISASVLAIAGSSLGSGAGRAMSHGVDDLAPAIARLRSSAIANVSQNVITGVTEEGAALLRDGTGNLSGAEIAVRIGQRTAQSVGRGLTSGLSEVGGQEVSAARSQPDSGGTPSASHTDTPTGQGTTTPPQADTTPPPSHTTSPTDHVAPPPEHTPPEHAPPEHAPPIDAGGTSASTTAPPHPDTPIPVAPEPRSPHPDPDSTIDDDPTIPDHTVPTGDDEITIPNHPLPPSGTSGSSHTSGVNPYPEGLVHYGLTPAEAQSSYRTSLQDDPEREAGIWMDPTTGEYIVVQGGSDFVSTGWSQDPDFAGRPWRLVEHFHPGDDIGARFASPEDFACMIHPQLVGQVPQDAVSTEIRWRDPESHLEFVTQIGYDPNLPEPYWIRYRDAEGQWQIQRFSDTPWNAGSDYIRFLQSLGIPQPTIPGRMDNPASPGNKGGSPDTAPPNVSSTTTGSLAERKRILGTDPKRGYIEHEGDVGAMIEDKYGGFDRDLSGDGEWISRSGPYQGKTFDLLGIPPGKSRFHSDQLENFLPSVDSHFLKAIDFVVLDTRYMTPGQKATVLAHVQARWSSDSARLILLE